MRKGGGKEKGSNFEREISKRLTLWLSEKTEPDLFWRSPGSGAKATTDKAKGRSSKNTDGDIISIAEESAFFTNKFFLECKNYKDIDVLSILVGKGNFLDFWAKAEKEAEESSKIPILIFKKNRSNVFVALPTDFIVHFTLQSNNNFFDFQDKICMNIRLKDGKDIWLSTLDTLLDYVKPGVLESYLRN